MTSWQGFDKVILLWRVLQRGSVNWNWPEKPEHCTYVHTEKHRDTSGFFFIQHGGMWRHLPLAHQSLKRGFSPQRGVQFLSIFFYVKKEDLDKVTKWTPCLRVEHLFFISSILRSTQWNAHYASYKAFCARNRLIVISLLFCAAPFSMHGVFVPCLFQHGRMGECLLSILTCIVKDFYILQTEGWSK